MKFIINHTNESFGTTPYMYLKLRFLIATANQTAVQNVCGWSNISKLVG